MQHIYFLDKKYKILNDDYSGVECIFVQVSPRQGLKLYYSKIEANGARNRQLKAHKHGIGPKVLSEVGLVCYNERERYAYKTQVAKVITDETEFGGQRWRLIKKAIKVFGKKKIVDDETVREFNTGKIGKRLVIIDFGMCSFKR